MADEKKLLWIKIASPGRFKGHPTGPFELTSKTFDEIVANFNRAGLAIPIDAEHASEQPATEGNIPVTGAPAFGWIHKLENRGAQGLWGLVEWLEPAKSYIKEGRYKYLSPAIRLRSKDTVTGEPIGARLSSAAITNTPFLRDLGVLAAKDIDQRIAEKEAERAELARLIASKEAQLRAIRDEGATRTRGGRAPDELRLPIARISDAAAAPSPTTVRMTMTDMARAIAKERKCSFSEAMLVADQIARRNRQRAAGGR